MAGAAIWKGHIHFGDTNVPVKLHIRGLVASRVDKEDGRFNFRTVK